MTMNNAKQAAIWWRNRTSEARALKKKNDMIGFFFCSIE